jgi:hypothetical protein
LPLNEGPTRMPLDASSAFQKRNSCCSKEQQATDLGVWSTPFMFEKSPYGSSGTVGAPRQAQRLLDHSAWMLELPKRKVPPRPPAKAGEQMSPISTRLFTVELFTSNHALPNGSVMASDNS